MSQRCQDCNPIYKILESCPLFNLDEVDPVLGIWNQFMALASVIPTLIAFYIIAMALFNWSNLYQRTFGISIVFIECLNGLILKNII